jgi:outer membrane protein assembly factor BamD
MSNQTPRHSFYLRHIGRHIGLIAVIALSAFVSACSSNNSAGPIQNITERDERRIAKLKEEQLYQRARQALDSSAWDSALQLYNDIELRYPFSETARQAQLESLFAHYRLFQEDLVVSLANQFINQYPRHPHVDYAHYMKGLANFRRATPDVGSWFRSDNSVRDPGYAREAFFAFSRLVNSLPNSDYAHDARLRMLFLRERLAKHQWHIVQYYQRKNAWVAVVNRAKLLLEDYSGSSFTQPALLAMAEAYDNLGMTALAEDANTLAQLNTASQPNPGTDTFTDSELEQLIPALKQP